MYQEPESSLLTQFGALKETTSNKAAARKIARNKETIATLLEAIRSKPNFTKMVEYSLECLRNLAVDEGSVEEMIEENVVETVLTVLKLNPYNEKIQTMANALLASFCINDNLAQLVGSKTSDTHLTHFLSPTSNCTITLPHLFLHCSPLSYSGAAPIIHSLRKHVESGTLTSSCATALRLMRSEDNVHLLVKSGIMGALHHLFATQEESPTVMEAATECAAIIARHPFHSHLLIDSSVAQDVLTALRHYPENERIVQAGLGTFHALIGTAPTGTTGTGALSPKGGRALKDAVMGMDGLIDTLITAIECHPDNDALLDSGCGVSEGAE